MKDSAGKITEEDVFLDEVEFDFGMKEKNPFDHIMFFSKHHTQGKDPEPHWIDLADVSSFLPAKFQEKVVRLYCKNTNKFEEAKRFGHFTVFFSLLSISLFVASLTAGWKSIGHSCGQHRLPHQMPRMVNNRERNDLLKPRVYSSSQSLWLRTKFS